MTPRCCVGARPAVMRRSARGLNPGGEDSAGDLAQRVAAGFGTHGDGGDGATAAGGRRRDDRADSTEEGIDDRERAIRGQVPGY
jgi:hypothetical protein